VAQDDEVDRSGWLTTRQVAAMARTSEDYIRQTRTKGIGPRNLWSPFSHGRVLYEPLEAARWALKHLTLRCCHLNKKRAPDNGADGSPGGAST
jgi:hypothetical protein